jgi:hypothetical protein
MNDILDQLEKPQEGENYLDYKARMEAIHGSEHARDIKNKFFEGPELSYV